MTNEKRITQSSWKLPNMDNLLINSIILKIKLPGLFTLICQLKKRTNIPNVEGFQKIDLSVILPVYHITAFFLLQKKARSFCNGTYCSTLTRATCQPHLTTFFFLLLNFELIILFSAFFAENGLSILYKIAVEL